jgi:hypothetical protein
MGKNVIQLDCYNLYQKKKSNQKRKEKKKGIFSENSSLGSEQC